MTMLCIAALQKCRCFSFGFLPYSSMPRPPPPRVFQTTVLAFHLPFPYYVCTEYSHLIFVLALGLGDPREVGWTWSVQ